LLGLLVAVAAALVEEAFFRRLLMDALMRAGVCRTPSARIRPHFRYCTCELGPSNGSRRGWRGGYDCHWDAWHCVSVRVRRRSS
jgi:hypothetical protein